MKTSRQSLPACMLFLVISGLFFLSSPLAAETVRIKQVYDGDTVLLADGRRARLLGINTPERGAPYSRKAKRMTESLILDRDVFLEFDEVEKDGYGRLLAYVFWRGEMVNARLVREGLAHVQLIGTNTKYAKQLLNQQAGARKKRKGLWSIWGHTKPLKITSLHLGENALSAYVRIVSLNNKPVQLSGYALINEAGNKFVFPASTLEAGHTVIVTGSNAAHQSETGAQIVFYWPREFSLQEKGDTIFLLDKAGKNIDRFSKGPADKKRSRNQRVP